MEFRLHIEYRG